MGPPRGAGTPPTPQGATSAPIRKIRDWRVRHQSAIAYKEFDEQQRLGVVAAHPRRRPHDLQLPHELNQIVLFLGSEFEFQDQIEELHSVFQRQEPAVMKIRWAILDTT